MNNSVKVALYVALALIASVSGYYALTSFGSMMSRAGQRNSELEQIEPERRPPVETAEPSPVNTVSSNTLAIADTNLPSALTNASSLVASNTNIVSDTLSETNTPAAIETNVPVVASAESATLPPPTAKNKPTPKKGGGHLGLWTALFIVSLIGLGLLIANDTSQFFGNRALKTLYNDEGEGQKNPEYEEAEAMWANGDHLEAIKMMREYLARNPREQHVAIRIAEIYEKDLKNNLAAALEYEEVLKHKLAPERWGRAAIHLCNLYFRLNQEQKGFDLLRRIVHEHPATTAADKARKRLEQVDGAGPIDQIAADSPQSTAARSGSPNAPVSNLPPGFRPKK